MHGIENQLDPYLGSQGMSLSYVENQQYYETHSCTLDSQSPEATPPIFDTGAPPTATDSILQDDRALFQKYEQFLAGEIDQQEFQASYCTRLLFIWEWVFHLSFWNLPSAIQTWYQILEKEDVWLWVNGDETRGPLYRLIRPWPAHNSSTDMDSSCILSRAQLQRGVEILRNRLLQEFDPKTSLPWRQRLDQHPNALLRYAAVVLKIAISDPIRAIEGTRRIKGRTVNSLFSKVDGQFRLKEDKCALECPRWDTYVSEITKWGHTCIYPKTHHDVPMICIVLNLLEVFAPDFPITVPSTIPSEHLTYTGDSECPCPICQTTRRLLISDVPWNGEAPRVPTTSELTHAAVPSTVLRFLWHLWFSSVDLDVHNWIRWLASLADYTRCTGFWNRYRARLIVACLLSPQMEAWITTSNYSTYRHLNQPCFGSGEILDHGEHPSSIYIPTPDDWKTAEAALGKAVTVLEPGQKLPDILATLGVLFCWISTQSVATPLPDIYTFCNLISNPYKRSGVTLPKISQHAVPLDVKSRIVKKETWSQCCPQVDDRVLDWYIASAALIIPKNEINTGRSMTCRCDRTTAGDVTRVFDNFCTGELGYGPNNTEVEGVLRNLVDIAENHGHYVRHRFEFDCSDDEAEQEPRKKDKRISPTAVIIPRKPSKSHQIEAIKTHLLDRLRELESATGQIPALSSGGKQKITLPWKTLTQILKERGYGLENWPAEVPLPGSGSELCDDNKGIHGLKAKHLRALYNATQDKKKPLGFREVGNMAPATVGMEKAAMRRGTIRGWEASEEREAGPSKRRRVDSNGAGKKTEESTE